MTGERDLGPWLDRWNLTDPRPLPGSRYNRVVLVTTSAGRLAVLKIGDPLARIREAAALRAWQGQGAVGLLAAAGAGLLVDYLPDAVPVERLPDDEATTAIGATITRLHAQSSTTAPGIGVSVRASDHLTSGGLPVLDALRCDLTGAMRRADPRLPVDLLTRATCVLDELLADPAAQVVLHGDLHHGNVLVTVAGPTAIDPHGWLGDPHLDAASLLANPRGLLADTPDPVELTNRRVAILAEVTGLDPDRMRAWAFVGSVIAEVWCLQDHNTVHGAPLRLALGLGQTC